jgi:hypothetical protein
MQKVSFEQLLTNIPPYVKVECSGFLCNKTVESQSEMTSNAHVLHNTNIISGQLRPKLFCNSEQCGIDTFFEMLADSNCHLLLAKGGIHAIHFRCCNCGENIHSHYLKIDALKGRNKTNANNETIFTIEKVGQFPKFGKTIPSKASKLLGKERELFFKGASAENQGMGIGAFSYYRRVLDLQKNKIFQEVIKVLEMTQGNNKLIQELQDAQIETQFTKAVDKISTALPDSLSIKGHNPLKLLYSALSEGLHSQSDAECLEIAQSIKIVLFELSERLASALNDSDELNEAVKRLVHKTVSNQS